MQWRFPEEQRREPEKVLVAAPAPQRTLTAAPAPRMSSQEINEILERMRLRKEKAEQDKARAKAEHDASIQRSVARVSPDIDLLRAIHAKFEDYETYLHFRQRLLSHSQRDAALDELSADPDLKPYVDRARR